MRSIVFPLTSISLAALVLAACGAEGPSAGDLNNMDALVPDPSGSTTGPATTQTTTGPATTPGPTPASTPTTTMTSGPNPPAMASSTSAPVPTSGPNTDPTGPQTDPQPTDTNEPVDPMPTDTAGAGGAPPTVDPMPTTTEPVPGAGGMPPVDPAPVSTEPVTPPPVDAFSPRSGPFNMLVYTQTLGFPHPSIPDGVAMLEQIAAENGITMTETNTNELITPEGLANFELIFFMNPTGDIFNNTEQQVFEDWMTSETGGAFAGTHSATDTERGWAFYSEVTGQYYDGHGSVEEGTIQWEPAALTHPTVVGLPNPWNRREEWYKFSSANWEGKEGFQILSRITNNDGTRPVSYVREFSNFRSFYTSLGHESAAFQDADVKKHVTAGILWAVRREAQIP